MRIGLLEIVVIVLVVAIVVSYLARRSVRRSMPAVPLPPPSRELDGATIDHITELVRQGKRIEAIKRYREATREGLRESKEAIEAWDQAGRASSSPAPTPVVPDDDDLAIGARAVQKASGDVSAIKYVRGETGWGLADAKAYVDRLR